MNLKKKLKKNKLTIGSWIMMDSNISVEVMSLAKFDWLAIDIEHTSINLETTENLIRTIQSKNLHALVRVSKNEEVIIKKVLDMGADGIIVPMICTKEDASQAVQYAKYPPTGKRGVGLYRAQNYGLNLEKYKKWLNQELIIIAQIEHISAVDNIDEIISVKGIDGAILGPYDLSSSMGFPGEIERNDVQKEIKKVLKKCKKKKVPLGIHVVDSDPKKIEAKIRQGYSFLAYGIDYVFMRDGAIKGMNSIKNNKTKKN